MLGIDVSGKLHNALNGLNFVKAFYTAYNSSSGLSQEKVSILHMEAFLFLMAHQDHDGIPLLNLQEALGHAQAKMQRLAVALQKVGWITLKKDPNDGRQRIVYLTEKGLALFDQLSPCFSE
jgi:DNA-binding MarR family transcriptional regulator